MSPLKFSSIHQIKNAPRRSYLPTALGKKNYNSARLLIMSQVIALVIHIQIIDATSCSPLSISSLRNGNNSLRW